MSDTTELVDLAVIFPDLEIELKYACADNITGKAIYQQARCLLHKDAITALAKSISIAQLSGLQLVIYDAYRPQQAQAMLWQACPDPQYVVDVTVGSNHSRGTAIDLTLRDEHGNILDMGAGFDEMHERSHAYHPSVPPAAQRNRLLLNAIMTKGLPGNRSFYENSEVDKLLRNALATTDQTQRTRDYQQAQKIVIDDAAYVYLFQKNYQLAMNKEVKGFVFNPMLEQVFNINTMSK
ncbi:D-alanyl-D-alanine dipeptidase [Escherichia coli]|nr:D-alanyl-D-alanine dipeptidase [Escherichia coli]EFJ3241292.1 D-alanyl-D-alanine dipeptidase [Escherichia coli]RDS20422.1 D-alanyl-D-alanine dipeptidase [Escherichia coli]HBA7589413.1 D-alanyl-D-alanine dipeptidase [Escherichia coli]